MITSITVVFSLLCLSVNAQNIGIKGGLNFATVSNYGDNNRVSGNVGLYFHSKLNRTWAIQPEILYSGEGVKYYTTPYGAENTLALSYIQVPIMFQYYPVRQFYLEFGPQIGALINASVKDDNNNKINVNSDYNKLAVSLDAGMGIQATRQLGFFARYNFGMTDVTSGDNQSYYSNVGQLGLTLRLQ